MRPKERICYGCKGGDGSPLRIKLFGGIDKCPKCSRPFHETDMKPCTSCQSPTPGGGLCDSCKAERER